MKTKLTFLFTAIICFSFIADAKIFRLGYPGQEVAGVDYTNFNLLQAAANAGDTVQVYGSNSNVLITKQLVFIGFGYNLDQFPGLQVNNLENPSYITGLYFRAGSDGTIMEGISADYFRIGNDNNSPAGVSVNNITIKRCRGNVIFNNYYSAVSNVNVISCAMNSIYMQYSAQSNVTNLAVINSVISGGITLYNSGSSALILNCVSPTTTYTAYAVSLNDATCLVKNCIFGRAKVSSNPNTVYENNFFQEANPGGVIPGTNNRWNQNWADLFERLSGVVDPPGDGNNTAFNENYYILKSGSPAINGGFNGGGSPTDCGIFGGEPAYAYKIGGIPAVPSIYRLDAPALNTSGNPYNVTISVKSNN